MKKKFFIATIMAAVAVSFASCGSEPQTKSNTPAASGKPAAKEVKIAFVDLDSLMTRYQYYVDSSEQLEKKSAGINATLNNKGIAFQKEAAAFQEKLQKGTLTEEQALKIQADLQNKQAQLQALQQNLTEEFQKEQAKYNEALHDSVDNFLKSYNKTAGYTFILARSNDNILLADPKCDITDDVINGLNKRYKKKTGK